MIFIFMMQKVYNFIFLFKHIFIKIFLLLSLDGSVLKHIQEANIGGHDLVKIGRDDFITSCESPRRWSATGTGKEARTVYKGHSVGKDVTALAVSPDESMLAIGGGKKVSVVASNSGSESFSFQAPDDVSKLAWNSDFIYVGTQGGQFVAYDVQKRAEAYSVQLYSGTITCLHASTTNHIFTGCWADPELSIILRPVTMIEKIRLGNFVSVGEVIDDNIFYTKDAAGTGLVKFHLMSGHELGDQSEKKAAHPLMTIDPKTGKVYQTYNAGIREMDPVVSFLNSFLYLFLFLIFSQTIFHFLVILEFGCYKKIQGWCCQFDVGRQ